MASGTPKIAVACHEVLEAIKPLHIPRRSVQLWFRASRCCEQLRAGYEGSYAFSEKIDVEGLNHPKRKFDLAEDLIRRKYKDSDIELILGWQFQAGADDHLDGRSREVSIVGRFVTKGDHPCSY